MELIADQVKMLMFVKNCKSKYLVVEMAFVESKFVKTVVSWTFLWNCYETYYFSSLHKVCF